jgi:hypothetical protein
MHQHSEPRSPQIGCQLQVINSASYLLIAVLGDRGQHVRSTIAIAGLAADAPLETERLVQVKR